ncbi:MAG: hypothetical protein K6G56_00840 [Clostridiales bacterium]|nr:hypothetical protein [Clostridiales bacterium]
MNRRKASGGIFVDVAVLLFCLAIATSCLVSGIFAKFAASSGTAGAKARIASFNVGAELDRSDYSVDLVNGNTYDERKIFLTNSSEVAVVYSVKLVFNKKVDDFLKPTLGAKQGEPNTEGSVFEWKNVDVIDPGETAEEILKLVVDGTPSETEYDFQVIVTFTQVN